MTLNFLEKYWNRTNLLYFSLSLVSFQAGESRGLFKKTISKLSTEYRLQFVWPHCRKAISETENLSQKMAAGRLAQSGRRDRSATNDDGDVDQVDGSGLDSPRKSKSMGALKAQSHFYHPNNHSNHLPMVHKKRTTHFGEGAKVSVAGICFAAKVLVFCPPPCYQVPFSHFNSPLLTIHVFGSSHHYIHKTHP